MVHEDALVADTAIVGDVEGVDRVRTRVGVIENTSVGTEAGAVGDHVAGVDPNGSSTVEAIKRTCLLRLAVVHRTEPEPAPGIERAVIEAIVRQFRLDVRTAGRNRPSSDRNGAVRIAGLRRMYRRSSGTMKLGLGGVS